MKAQRSQQGFTLVELLVAGVIMALILGVLGSLFAGSTRAYRANEQAADRQQITDAAIQLLTYEIGLAGYRGSTSATSTRKFTTLALIPESTLMITKSATATETDTITVRYYEDRFVSAPTKTTVSFSVAKDSNNLYNLYRAQDADVNPGKPAVLGVKNLKVVKYFKKDGAESSNITAGALAALKLELTFTDTDPETVDFTRQVVIGIPNSQQLPVLPSL